MRRSLCDEVCRCISYFYIASVGRWGSNCLGINSITMTRLVTGTGLFVMGLKRKAFFDLHCSCESWGAGKSGVCMTSYEPKNLSCYDPFTIIRLLHPEIFLELDLASALINLYTSRAASINFIWSALLYWGMHSHKELWGSSRGFSMCSQASFWDWVYKSVKAFLAVDYLLANLGM